MDRTGPLPRPPDARPPESPLRGLSWRLLLAAGAAIIVVVLLVVIGGGRRSGSAGAGSPPTATPTSEAVAAPPLVTLDREMPVGPAAATPPTRPSPSARPKATARPSPSARKVPPPTASPKRPVAKPPVAKPPVAKPPVAKPPAPARPAPPRLPAGTIAAAGRPAPGWASWSWDVAFRPAMTAPGGTKAMSVSFTGKYGGFSLRQPTLTRPPATATLRMRVLVTTATKLGLMVHSTDAGATSRVVDVSVPANRWTTISATVAALRPVNGVKRVDLLNKSGRDRVGVWVSDITLR